MVLSYGNLRNLESQYRSTLKSIQDFSELMGTPPKPHILSLHQEQPRFSTNYDESDSEEEDELQLLDLPIEVFYSSILPQMSLRDLKAFGDCNKYTRQLVHSSLDWDAKYESFGDKVQLDGLGFDRYYRRAHARSMVSGTVESGKNLKHWALAPIDNDILHLSLAHHSSKVYQTPFYASNCTEPVKSWAAGDMFLDPKGRIIRFGKALESTFNTNIVQLISTLALNGDGQVFRLLLDEAGNLCLAPLPLPVISYIICIKNRVFAIGRDIGIITWHSSEESSEEIDFDEILATDTQIHDLAVYQHNYGSLADIAFTTDDCIYTLQINGSANKAGLRHELRDCTEYQTHCEKIIYYEEGAFLAICDGTAYKLSKGKLTRTMLEGIADLAVSKQGFCTALTLEGNVLSWDLKTRRKTCTWALGAQRKTKVPMSCPIKAKLGKAVSLTVSDDLVFALVV